MLAGSATRGTRILSALLLVAQATAAAAVQVPPTIVAPTEVADPCQPQSSCPNEGRGYSRTLRRHQTTARPRAMAADADAHGRWRLRFRRCRTRGARGRGRRSWLVDELTSKDWASAKDLVKDGPKFPRAQAIGRYQVQGFALPGWPVALDVDSLPGTETWLEVAFKGDKKKQHRWIAVTGEGRRERVVTLPGVAEDGAEAKVARYSLHSFLREPDGKAVYQPLRVYGIGAGPRAVGSLLLKITNFSPTPAARPADVRYGLSAMRLFDRSVVEVLRLPKPGKGKLEKVKAITLSPLPAGTYPGDWASMRVDPRPASGTYHLQARGWLVGARDDERDWTGAIAPNLVRIP